LNAQKLVLYPIMWMPMGFEPRKLASSTLHNNIIRDRGRRDMNPRHITQKDFNTIFKIYKINSWFWTTFWSKKYKILTEIGHFDRNFDRKSSVGKTLVEITFWPIGQKSLTEFLTAVFGQNYISTEILTENAGQNIILTDIFGQNTKFWPNFDWKFGQNFILTEFFGQNSVKIREWNLKKNYLQNSYYSYCNNYSVIIICL